MSPQDASSSYDRVAHSALFANVPPEAVEQAMATIELREYRPDEHVIVESSSHSEDSCLYILVEGQLLVTRMAGGRVERLSTIAPGEFFGELARTDEGTRSATVTAVTPVTVARLPGAATDRLIADAPAVMGTLAAALARRLRAADESRIAARVNEERLSVIGRAAAMLVHDLRNPLGVVLNTAYMVEQKMGDPIELVARSKGAAEFMLDMVQDLLDFAKGDRVLARVPVNLRDVMEDIESFGLQPLEADGKIKVVRVPCGDAWLVGDRRALSRAFLNIVKNAAEVMPPGGTLSFVTDVRDNEVSITVADTGRGIPDEVLPTLFEPFATFAKAGGTGLGLAMTKATIEGHGGTIRVETKLGEGTAFIVVLPLHADSEQRGAAS